MQMIGSMVRMVLQLLEVVELLNLEVSLSSTSVSKLYPRLIGLAKAADGQSYDEAVFPVDRIITKWQTFLLGCWGEMGTIRWKKDWKKLTLPENRPKGPKMKGSSPNHPFSGASWQFWGGQLEFDREVPLNLSRGKFLRQPILSSPQLVTFGAFADDFFFESSDGMFPFNRSGVQPI